MQPTSEEEKMMFVSDEHYRREKMPSVLPCGP